jgi:hypothetical protein
MTLSNPVWLPQQPWKGGLVDRGLSFPDGVEWRTGVRFNSTGCVAPLLQDACNPTDKTPTRVGDEHEFLPTNAIQPVECATISNIDLERLARERLTATTEWALGQSLLLGTATEPDNPALSDVVATAYGCAEEALSKTLALAAQAAFGTALTVHLTVEAAVLLAERIAAIDWVTFIVSPGYGTGAQIWVTGPTYVGVDADMVLSGTFREQNTAQNIAERLVLAVFDPCVLFSGTFPNDCGIL